MFNNGDSRINERKHEGEHGKPDEVSERADSKAKATSNGHSNSHGQIEILVLLQLCLHCLLFPGPRSSQKTKSSVTCTSSPPWLCILVPIRYVLRKYDGKSNKPGWWTCGWPTSEICSTRTLRNCHKRRIFQDTGNKRW